MLLRWVPLFFFVAVTICGVVRLKGKVIIGKFIVLYKKCADLIGEFSQMVFFPFYFVVHRRKSDCVIKFSIFNMNFKIYIKIRIYSMCGIWKWFCFTRVLYHHLPAPFSWFSKQRYPDRVEFKAFSVSLNEINYDFLMSGCENVGVFKIKIFILFIVYHLIGTFCFKPTNLNEIVKIMKCNGNVQWDFFFKVLFIELWILQRDERRTNIV